LSVPTGRPGELDPEKTTAERLELSSSAKAVKVEQAFSASGTPDPQPPLEGEGSPAPLAWPETSPREVEDPRTPNQLDFRDLTDRKESLPYTSFKEAQAVARRLIEGYREAADAETARKKREAYAKGERTRRRNWAREFVPKQRFQLPGEAKSQHSEGFMYGPVQTVQRVACIVWAVEQGNHSNREISEAVNRIDPHAAVTSAVVEKLARALALTGLLVPYIEALQQKRYRWMWYLHGKLPGPDTHLLTLTQCNERVEGDEDKVSWMRPSGRA
jgi:hypothetical protein